LIFYSNTGRNIILGVITPNLVIMYKLLIYSFLLFVSCNSGPTNSTNQMSLVDSINIARKADSMTKAIIKDALFDTAGVSSSPVKVLSAKLVIREYSNYKDVWLSWKNVGTKKVAAIRFKWYGTNAFGEPADMGSTGLQEGFGGGFADRSLGIGKRDEGTWSIMSRDGKKIVMAWPYEVAFEDGTKWKSGK
jgi:hypothetical protein